jgi:hypothetical protein
MAVGLDDVRHVRCIKCGKPSREGLCKACTPYDDLGLARCRICEKLLNAQNRTGTCRDCQRSGRSKIAWDKLGKYNESIAQYREVKAPTLCDCPDCQARAPSKLRLVKR